MAPPPAGSLGWHCPPAALSCFLSHQRVDQRLQSKPDIMTARHIEGEQNTPPQNVPLRHKDYFEMIIFERQQMREKLWEQSKAESTFIKEVSIRDGTVSGR